MKNTKLLLARNGGNMSPGKAIFIPFFICFLAYSTKLNKFPVFNFDDDLKYLCISAVSANTTKATLYALNVWRYWCMTKGLRDYMDITKVRKLSKIVLFQSWEPAPLVK